MNYFLSAGEASGDLHGAELITQLRQIDPEATFTFLGGDRMAAAAGCQPVIHIKRMAYMGFSEVLRHLRTILGNLSLARKAMLASRPDALILIDYPSFNLKLAKAAHKAGIPVHYYISPKVWAWKEWRVKTIRRVVDRLYAIFPFEPDFYRRHGMEVEYVGNPSVEEVTRRLAAAPARSEFLAAHKLRDRRLIALLPGSRRSEIRNNLRIMSEVEHQFPQYRGVIAGAPGIEPEFYARYSQLPVVFNATYDLLAHSHAALVTSGTATLEAALARVPQVVTYRANGSKLSYNIMKRLLKVRFVSLPNLIVGHQIIPEQLLHLCTPELVAEQLAAITADGPARQAQLDGYDQMHRLLGDTHAAQRTARAIYDSLT